MPIHKVENDQTIPMVVTVPNRAAPDAGWPVVIFQHGITRNRTDIFAVASTLLLQGLSQFPSICRCMVCHQDNPFYKNQLLEKVIAATVILPLDDQQ
jgi:hypothetical protein